MNLYIGFIYSVPKLQVLKFYFQMQNFYSYASEFK